MEFIETDLSGARLHDIEEWLRLRMSNSGEAGVVSVIIPTYNRVSLLEEAIDSVWNQTYRPIELLVVDDGSKDNTAEFTRKKFASLPSDPQFRAHYIRQPNRGASTARNQGLLHCRGEFIQYLDSDDVLVRHKVERDMEILKGDANVDIVWSNWWVVSADQLHTKLSEANKLSAPANSNTGSTQKLIPWEPWPSLTRRRFIAKQPLWDEYTSRWDDWEYALRLLAEDPVRVHYGNIGCIQREHDNGRRYDYHFRPEGIMKGMAAARSAGAARDRTSKRNDAIDQLVADRYWEIFLEALDHGTREQATEAAQGAVKYGRRSMFLAKIQLCRLLLTTLGTKSTRKLMERRYYAS